MKRLFFTLLLFAIIFQIKAQGLQPGECGIRYTYDASGLLLQREFICNNGGTVITKVGEKPAKTITNNAADPAGITEELTAIAAVMPNPTTGVFSVKMTNALKNATVTIATVDGKNVLNAQANGTILTYNITHFATGVYIVTIVEGKKKLSFKLRKD